MYLWLRILCVFFQTCKVISANMAAETEDDQISISSGGIFSDNASFIAPADATAANENDVKRPKFDISLIRNKQRRSEAFQKFKREAKKVCKDYLYVILTQIFYV